MNWRCTHESFRNIQGADIPCSHDPVESLHPSRCVPWDVRDNAIQATDGRGHLLVSAGCEEEELFVRIADDGPGIPEAHRERLFEPFFTTKPVGEGTGLGLYVSYEIVSSHGGRIEVHSEDGSGTCFEVRLPRRPLSSGGPNLA